ncbi:MAG: RluA family pseudouridine synthase [Candidatus Acetothermia bacterium]
MKTKHLVDEQEEGTRLDKLLARLDDSQSRSRWQKQIAGGGVRVNGAEVKSSYQVEEGEQIEVDPPEDFHPHGLKPQDLPLDVVYEDAHVIGIDKKISTVVHPGSGNWDGTLANALVFHYDNLPRPDDNLRPGIVHRLDKDTSGVLVIARTELAYDHISTQFKMRTVEKEYLALVGGNFTENHGLIDAPIGRDPKAPTNMTVKYGGKDSQTEFSVVSELDDSTLLRVRPHTGRTHQIRVHMDYIGHSIIGDKRYGGRPYSRFMLHSRKISLTHPVTGEKLTLESPAPDEFTELTQ